MKEQITSSKQALKLSKALKSYWSAETLLTQRILIYVASILEKSPHHKNKRKSSKWQLFLSAQMRQGKSVQEAGRLWREKSK